MASIRMNKNLVLAGGLTLVASALHAAYAPGLSSLEQQKPWSVSASVRGFYDDNYTTSPKQVVVAGKLVDGAQSSFGCEVTPQLAINLPYEQTFISASYVYSLKYYDDNSFTDQSHQFNAHLGHAFSERYSIDATEQYVIAQEPEVFNTVGTITVPLRVQGNNVRNTATAKFDAQMTELLGTEFSYQNNFYSYDNSGPSSYSASLDRVEHYAEADLRYQWQKPTVLVLAYQFGWVDHTSDDFLIGTTPPSSRNVRSHFLKVGADHNFNDQLNGSIRVGVEYDDYYNANKNSVAPYADAS